MNPKKNGKRLRELRIARGMTGAEFADAIGVTESSVYMYESGERTPRDDKKVAIANFFGTTVAKLFFADETTNSCLEGVIGNDA